jgi:hypothetical protein
LSKVSTPIREKQFDTVEKRNINPSDGNPSDANYKKQSDTTFKMKVVSNRRAAPDPEKLEKIVEEPIEKSE